VILHPGVLALLAGSLLVGGLLLVSAWNGLLILRRWDLASGSALQLSLERRTYLVSTIVGYVLAFELASLFLYVYTADALAPMFTGAMCAAGTLAANGWGYTVLVLRLANFVLAGLWLVVNRADELGHDYPLVRAKYALLLALTPLVLAEVVLQARYFLALEPEVITSCCGSLFSKGGTSAVGAGMAAIPAAPLAVALYATAGTAGGAGAAFGRWWRGGGGVALALVLAVAAALALGVGLAALVSWVSPYVYELPTHRCPFCLLQREYGWVGYPLYGTLLGAAVCGMGVGVLVPARRIPSLAAAVPVFQRRLAIVAAALFAIFVALVTWKVLASHLAA
jgi:hypothetical protein